MATINNTASATYSFGRSETASVISNTATTNLIEEYSISGSKITNNETFRNGENLTYQISVSNDGTSSLYNVTITDDLGGETNPLSFLECSGTYNINGITAGIIPTGVRPLVFVLPSPLASGETATITFIARVSSGLDAGIESITTTSTITANRGSTTGDKISVTPNPMVTISRGEFADVTITKDVSSLQISAGEIFSYRITLSNSGNLDATGVTITDTLPENFEINTITSETDGVTTSFSASDYTIDEATNTLTLPSGNTLSITVPAKRDGINGITVVTITGSIS